MRREGSDSRNLIRFSMFSFQQNKTKPIMIRSRLSPIPIEFEEEEQKEQDESHCYEKQKDYSFFFSSSMVTLASTNKEKKKNVIALRHRFHFPWRLVMQILLIVWTFQAILQFSSSIHNFAHIILQQGQVVPTEKEQQALLTRGTIVAVQIAHNQLPSLVVSRSEDDSYKTDRSFSNTKKYPSSTTTTIYQIPKSEWWIDRNAVEQALEAPHGCLVYSFGIGKQDSYTDYMASIGCQVFAFDPTQNHPQQWKPNVTFYSWGIRNSVDTTIQTGWSHHVYGNLTGTLLSLPEIVNALGHQDKVIAALKFDCEGCEYGAFKDIVDYERYTGNKFNPIWSLTTEFHFSTTLGMRTTNDVANVAHVKTFLDSQDCKVFHYRPNKGFRKDRSVNVHLVKNGVINGTCCYEYGFTCHGITGN